MSMKIRVSYTEEAEADAFLTVIQPVADLFNVKKCDGTPPFKHLYFTPKKAGKPRHNRDSDAPPTP